MDVLSQIRIMQTVRNLNNSQTAALLGSSRQNFSNKCERNNFSVNELQKIADVLGFDMDIIFTDRENNTQQFNNKYYTINNNESPETISVNSNEFKMLKNVLEAYRNK